MAREVIVALLLLAALAGCVQPDAETLEAASAQDEEIGSSPLLQELGAQPAAATNATSLPAAGALAANASAAGAPWWVIRVEATPEGGLAGAWLDLPPGARVPWRLNEDFEEDMEVLALEVAPIVPAGEEGNLESWGLVAMRRADGDGLGFSGGASHVAVEGDDAPAEPSFASIWDVEGATRVPFLAFAQTSKPMEVVLAFRFLDHDPDDEEEDPAATAGDFVAARNGTPPLALAATKGAGISFMLYDHWCFGGFPAGIPQCMEFRMGDVRVQRATDVAGLAYSAELAADPVFPRGYGLAGAGYFDVGTGGGRWIADVAARGKTLHGEGAQASAFATILVPGAPWVIANAGAYSVGDGEGDLGVVFSVDLVAAGSLLTSVSLSKIELGATLQDLFGEAAEADEYVTGPLPMPMARMQPDGSLRPLTPEERVATLFGGYVA